jgi:hypothetical protein
MHIFSICFCLAEEEAWATVEPPPPASPAGDVCDMRSRRPTSPGRLRPLRNLSPGRQPATAGDAEEGGGGGGERGGAFGVELQVFPLSFLWL